MRILQNYFLLPLVLATVSLSAQLQDPDAFLPHTYTAQFTPHHLLVDYFEHVAEESPRVRLEEYGRTNEGRPLLLTYVSTPANLERMEAIRENNLRQAGLLAGQPDPTLNDYAIVWLSFSVHGNEAAGSEASMSVLHALADPDNGAANDWLKNTIVIIDPALNPDGYNRYTNWYRQVASRFPDTELMSREHREPWPGGRVNHYLFDLNRDWAWQTQAETRQRMPHYLKWMPHLHADLHEQGHNSPYYFAPAAAPYHEYITRWQRDFQQEIGQYHASSFDQNGWLYFTAERFDLLYPSYGDTYPIFNGSIGMTYEQGGSHRGGRAVDLPNGDTLTLRDRIQHHYTTALNTVALGSRESDRLTRNFRSYFEKARTEPAGEYLTYVISGTTPRGRMQRLTELLDRNGIQYGYAGKGFSGRMYDYAYGEDRMGSINEGDLVISAYQPRGVLTQVLFDPATKVEDSITYDITAWSIPFAYGLNAFASKERLKLDVTMTVPARPTVPNTDRDPSTVYAYVVPWTDLSSAQVTAALIGAGLQVRTSANDFQFGEQTFPAGSTLVLRADNRKDAGFTAKVMDVAKRYDVTLPRLYTGLSTSGGDLGNGAYDLVGQPKIALLAGDGVNVNQFGQIWYYFEQELEYPVSVFHVDDLSDIFSSDYDVLILPSGRYSLKSSEKALSAWVKAGGKLIAFENANASLSALETFKLKKKEGTKDATDTRLLPYGDAERRFISSYNPGSIVAVELDATHPLSFGIGERYYSVKTSARSYDYLDEGVNAGRIRTAPFVSGFVGSKAKRELDETLVFGIQSLGRGQVVYLVDNPLYRGFWEQGKLLFANVLFQVR